MQSVPSPNIADVRHVLDDSSDASGANVGREESFLGVVELLLKAPGRLDQLNRLPAKQVELIPRFLAVGLVGYTMFAITLAVAFQAAGVWPQLTSMSDWLAGTQSSVVDFQSSTMQTSNWYRWLFGKGWHAWLAYNVGMAAAIGICLPSFYFYGLLAGVRISLLEVTAHSMKCLAAGATTLVGMLPIYVAFVLGAIVFAAADRFIEGALFFGLLLPFVAGLWGVRSLYIGIMALADTMTADQRGRREIFLRRLVLSWSACYTAVTPIMIFTLWEYVAR